MSLKILPKELEYIVDVYTKEVQHQYNFSKIAIELKETLAFRSKYVFYQYNTSHSNLFYGDHNLICYLPPDKIDMPKEQLDYYIEADFELLTQTIFNTYNDEKTYFQSCKYEKMNYYDEEEKPSLLQRILLQQIYNSVFVVDVLQFFFLWLCIYLFIYLVLDFF